MPRRSEQSKNILLPIIKPVGEGEVLRCFPTRATNRVGYALAHGAKRANGL